MKTSPSILFIIGMFANACKWFTPRLRRPLDVTAGVEEAIAWEAIT